MGPLEPERGSGRLERAREAGRGHGVGGAHLWEATRRGLARLRDHVSEDSGLGGQVGQPFEEAAAHPTQEGSLQGLSAAVAEVEAWQEAGEGGKEGCGCRPLPAPALSPLHTLQLLTLWSRP